MKEIQLTLILIAQLDKLNAVEFADYMKDKILVYNGKKYFLPVKTKPKSKKEKPCHVN